MKMREIKVKTTLLVLDLFYAAPHLAFLKLFQDITKFAKRSASSKYILPIVTYYS